MRVNALEDARLEERFFWIVGLMFVIDVFVFPQMGTWGGPIALLAIELIMLIILGRKCGVEDISRLTDRIIDSLGRHHRGK